MSKTPSTTKSLSTPDVTAAGGAAESLLRGGADPVETAKFVADFTIELASLARRSRLDLLAYLLDMARLEAIRIVQASNPES
jgi:hypothetical protein